MTFVTPTLFRRPSLAGLRPFATGTPEQPFNVTANRRRVGGRDSQCWCGTAVPYGPREAAAIAPLGAEKRQPERGKSAFAAAGPRFTAVARPIGVGATAGANRRLSPLTSRPDAGPRATQGSPKKAGTPGAWRESAEDFAMVEEAMSQMKPPPSSAGEQAAAEDREPPWLFSDLAGAA